MNDPLFGSAPLLGGALLFADGDEDAAPVLGDVLGGGDELEVGGYEGGPLDGGELGLDGTIVAQVLPWWAGAFALVLSDLPSGTPSLHGPHGVLPSVAQARVLRGDGQTILLVVSGAIPAASDAAHVLVVAGPEGEYRFPVRFERAPFDRTLATLIAQAMAIEDAGRDARRNWQPLIRYLQSVADQSARAQLSLPVGDGIALLLDGDLGPDTRRAPALILDGGLLSAATAHLATDVATGRAVVLVPVIGARFFVFIDDALVELACPAGATRSYLGRAPDAPLLRPSEAELLLDLVAEAGLAVDPRPAEVLPLPGALGWRNADGTGLAVVGGLAVEAGTALFIASDGAEHDLGRLTIRDLANAAAPLLEVARPIAAFHPDAEAMPARLYLSVMLPRRLGAGSLHVSLANGVDAGGWIRLLDPAAPQAQSILHAWLPPPPDDDVYLRLVAASVRWSVSRLPPVVVEERLPPALSAADTIAVILGLGADAAAIETTVASIAGGSHRSIPLLVVLRSSDIGFDKTVTRLTTVFERHGMEFGVLTLAGPVGAAAALSVVLDRHGAETVAVFEAGCAVSTGDWLAAAERGRRGDCLVVAEAPVAAVLSRSAGQRLLAGADRRLSSVSAMLHDFARIAEDNDVTVVRAAGFEVVAGEGREAELSVQVDRVLTNQRPTAASRGSA